MDYNRGSGCLRGMRCGSGGVLQTRCHPVPGHGAAHYDRDRDSYRKDDVVDELRRIRELLDRLERAAKRTYPRGSDSRGMGERGRRDAPSSPAPRSGALVCLPCRMTGRELARAFRGVACRSVLVSAPADLHGAGGRLPVGADSGGMTGPGHSAIRRPRETAAPGIPRAPGSAGGVSAG